MSSLIDESGDAPMKLVGRPYDSIEEMIEENSSPEFIDHLRQYRANRLITNALTMGRMKAGITVEEMTLRTGWCEEELLDFEEQEDGDLNLRDLRTYVSAVRIQLDIKFQAASDDPASLAAIEGINMAIQGGNQ
jgi:hypothetical protein